jgi:hypothetical protein
MEEGEGLDVKVLEDEMSFTEVFIVPPGIYTLRPVHILWRCGGALKYSGKCGTNQPSD